MEKMNETTKTPEIHEEQNLATDVLKEVQRTSRQWIIFAAVAFTVIGAALIYQMTLNQQNNKRWIELFSSYDYVSQDGEGLNNINTGSQGDLSNIPDEE